MAGVSLSVTPDSHPLQGGLGRLRFRLEDPTRVWDEIGALLVSSAQQRIQDEEDPQGVRWPELAESTQKRRLGDRDGKGRYRGKGSRLRGKDHMLRVKGHLFNSLTHRASREGAEAGSALKYAGLQQMGGTEDMESAGAAANPGRPFLGVSKEDEQEIAEILHDYLERGR